MSDISGGSSWQNEGWPRAENRTGLKEEELSPMRSTRLARVAGCLAAAAVVLTPAVAEAQYTAPPPEPGFRYIFDGTATGSDASFDKWRFASGSLANSDSAGRAALDPNEGSFIVNASPFGAYWYTAKAFGDA